MFRIEEQRLVQIDCVLDKGECVIAAAIWVNKRLYYGPSHCHAVLQALNDGNMYRENGTYQSVDGIRELDLFLTNKSRLLTREEAQLYWGEDQSENLINDTSA